jgi:hypothetical protein
VPVKFPFGDQLTLYDDAVHSPLGAGGGWGGVTTDANNTEKPRVGTKLIKVTYTGIGGGGALNSETGVASQYRQLEHHTTRFRFMEVLVLLENQFVLVLLGKTVDVAFVEGAWKDVQIPLSSFNSPTGISEIWFQDMGWTGVVYIDQIGLK